MIVSVRGNVANRCTSQVSTFTVYRNRRWPMFINTSQIEDICWFGSESIAYSYSIAGRFYEYVFLTTKSLNPDIKKRINIICRMATK